MDYTSPLPPTLQNNEAKALRILLPSYGRHAIWRYNLHSRSGMQPLNRTRLLNFLHQQITHTLNEHKTTSAHIRIMVYDRNVKYDCMERERLLAVTAASHQGAFEMF